MVRRCSRMTTASEWADSEGGPDSSRRGTFDAELTSCLARSAGSGRFDAADEIPLHRLVHGRADHGPADAGVLEIGVGNGVPLGLGRYASLGHAVGPRSFTVRSGGLVREQAVLQRRAVVGWRVRQSYFQRRSVWRRPPAS